MFHELISHLHSTLYHPHKSLHAKNCTRNINFIIALQYNNNNNNKRKTEKKNVTGAVRGLILQLKSGKIFCTNVEINVNFLFKGLNFRNVSNQVKWDYKTVAASLRKFRQ